MLETDDQLLTRGSRYAKSDSRYWSGAIFRRVRNRKGQKQRAKFFSIQLQFSGRREEFGLGSANKVQAALRAREIYEHLKVNGWAATCAKYKHGKESEQTGVRTVGEFIRAIQATTPSANRSIVEYVRRFRKVVSDIFELDGDASKKYDYRSAGRDARLKQIDTIRLSALTPALVMRWRIGYLNKAGKSPAAQRSAKISLNSTVRQAAALFAPKRLQHVQLPSTFISPFKDVQMEPRQNMRYRSSFDAQKLIANAKNELALAEPEMFKAFLLAIMTGLRRSEIDKLEWRAFDWQNLKIRVEPTEHLALKSEDASADVDLDPQLTKVLQEFYARRTGTFVIESPRPSRVGTSYLAYRCGPIFKRLATWLRAHGVASSKPLHCLRKEYGSLVCQKHGIFAASRALRHSDISVTAAHYVEPRAKATTGLGSLL